MKRTSAVLSALAVFLLFAAGTATAQVRTDVQAILSNPNGFDGRKVEVEGRVESLRSRLSAKGSPYTTFKLAEDGDSLSVFTLGDARLKEGDIVKVTGRFQKIRYLSQYVFLNEIDATDGQVVKAEQLKEDEESGS
ncbi:MAG: hypothetical protein HYV23_07775 [Deltaproteobacteria bacterium]|nr:hypothetical protein [Deltaproteobacteria bacterium]